MNKPVSFKPVTPDPAAGSNREDRLTRGWRRNLPISLLGGVALMSAAAIGQALHFGIEQLSVSSLGTPFILGAVATYLMLRLMQRSLGEQRGRLEWEFLQRTLDLRKTEARFEQFTESADEWFWETDADDRLVFLSSRLYQVSGLSPDTLIGKKREELRMHPMSLEEAEQWAYYRRCIERREPYENLQYRSQMADGRIVLFRSSGKPFYDVAGNFVGYRGTASDVTEETARESSIEANRELIYNATAILSDGFYLFDADDRLVMCNSRYREIFAPIAALLEPGAPYAEIMRAIAGQLEFADETERQVWLSQSLQRHREPGIPIDAQLFDGGWIQIKEQGLPDGGLVGLCIDVSESKAIEKELEMAQRISDIGSYRMDFDSGTIISISPQLAHIYGLSLEQVRTHEDQYMIDRVHPDDRDRVRETYEIARRSKNFRAGDLLFEIEYRLLRGGGEVRHILERADIARVRDGRISEVVGTMQDITERRRVEQAMQEAERLAKTGSYRWDLARDRMISCTPEFLRIFDVKPEHVIHRSVDELEGLDIHPEDRERVLAVYRDCIKAKGITEVEYRHLTRAGETRYLVERLRTSKWIGDKPVEQIGTVQDITDRRVVEQDKRASEDLLEAAIENVPGGFLMVDKEGIITRFNRRFFDLYPQQQFYINEGLPFERFIEYGIELGVYAEAVDDPETWLQQRRAQTKSEQIEFIERLSDGRSIQVASRRLSNGTRVGIHVDVTELENARLAAEQANAAKSDFLASMSHELRTPMHGILSFAELGIKRMESLSQEKLSQYLENIQTSGNRLLFLLNDLLDLSKLEAGKMRLDIAPLNLVDLVQACINEQAIQLHENQLGCELVTNLSGARCDCDRNRIHQVVSNVLSNAIKFSPEGGRIEIGLESVEGGFRVEVADQGIGIPEAERDQIFDKFYQSARSRNHSGGTGLGLAICREIIELHGGRIWAENNAEGGSRILFELPGETRLH